MLLACDINDNWNKVNFALTCMYVIAGVRNTRPHDYMTKFATNWAEENSRYLHQIGSDYVRQCSSYRPWTSSLDIRRRLKKSVNHGQDSNQQAGAPESNALTTTLRTTDANWSVATPLYWVMTRVTMWARAFHWPRGICLFTCARDRCKTNVRCWVKSITLLKSTTLCMWTEY